MSDFIWSVAVLAAIVVFVTALIQGKGFWNAARMGLGVLVLGFIAILAIGLIFGILSLTLHILWLALWVAVIFGIVVVVARVVRGEV